jgi:hypothetical protein
MKLIVWAILDRNQQIAVDGGIAQLFKFTDQHKATKRAAELNAADRFGRYYVQAVKWNTLDVPLPDLIDQQLDPIPARNWFCLHAKNPRPPRCYQIGDSLEIMRAVRRATDLFV